MKRLAGDAALAGVDHAGRQRRPWPQRGDVGILEHEERHRRRRARARTSSASRRRQAATLRPAGTLPVSVTAATFASSISALTPALGDQRGGEQALREAASRNTYSIASAQPGTFVACLSTPALPAISAGAAKRNTCQNGKFQGITASTTPSGLKVRNACAALDLHRLARQVGGGPVGEMLAGAGALVDLGERHRSRSCPFPRS